MFHSLSQLERRSHLLCYWIVRPHCTSWTNWNNREVVQVTRSYIFKRRFRCRCRCGFLKSLIDSQGRSWRRVGYNHLISNKREWNKCFIKNNQEILLDLADFTLQEQTEDNLMVAISQAWYNGSYTMAAKPIKSWNPGISLYNDPVFNHSVYSTVAVLTRMVPRGLYLSNNTEECGYT